MPDDAAAVPAGMRYENFAFAGEQAPRELRAVAPGPDAAAARAAYLELLKLSLCDLAGTRTVSVWADETGTVMSRILEADELQVRALGIDWPLQGLTMGGLHRLDDLQACVESVVADDVPGDVIEAGAWRGGSSILMRATLDALGAADRTVWVADSFAGFPPADADEPRLAGIDFLAVSQAEVEANFARLGLDRGVRFAPGFFADTMPGLAGERWSLVRLDGDSYDATRTTLEWLYPGLSVGGHLVVDDYGVLPDCRRAVDEFRERHGITEPIEQVDWTCVRWRRTSDARIAHPAPPPAAAPRQAVPPAPTEHAPVPSMQEVNLERTLAHREAELADARRRVGELEAELARLRDRPGRRAARWARRRLGR